MSQAGWWFESLDQLRKLQGRALDGMNLGPRESEYRVVFSRSLARLRSYGSVEDGRPVLLIVPAPIKRCYIWDLSPECSVVQRALDHGFAVYLVEWVEPQETDGALGLAEFVAMIDDCVGHIAEHSQVGKVYLTGHSLGGTLAGLYAAYRPQRAAGLMLVEAPLHFGEATGAFRPMLEADVPADSLLPPEATRVPGSLLNLISVRAAPRTFQLERYMDLMASLASKEQIVTHMRVERWTLDELALPRKLFTDVVEQLYREDRFMQRRLQLNGATLGPQDIAAPLFAIYEPTSTIVPPTSIFAFCKATSSREQECVPYLGDVGVALKHVGALIGESAHAAIWPKALDWLKRFDGR